jgi:DNA (cytosine-5)-methyltransferase 1
MDDRPAVLDLFCAAGGASMGYHQAGYTVVGVDVRRQRHYPFRLEHADALDVLDRLLDGGTVGDRQLDDYQLIHASPPCQHYSVASKAWNGGRTLHADLVEPTRRRLAETGRHYVIENVVGAPLEDPVMLCGTMFDGLRVLRHRLFECSFPVPQPDHPDHPLVHTKDKRKRQYGLLDEDDAFVMVNGGGNCRVETARAAMGIPWMTKDELNLAIPPAYTQYLAGQLALVAA